MTDTPTITVETTGDFMAQDPTNGQVIEAFGATAVEETAWVQEQIERGRLKKSGGKGKAAEKPGLVPEPSPEVGYLASADEEKSDDSKTDTFTSADTKKKN